MAQDRGGFTETQERRPISLIRGTPDTSTDTDTSISTDTNTSTSTEPFKVRIKAPDRNIYDTEIMPSDYNMSDNERWRSNNFGIRTKTPSEEQTIYSEEIYPQSEEQMFSQEPSRKQTQKHTQEPDLTDYYTHYGIDLTSIMTMEVAEESLIDIEVKSGVSDETILNTDYATDGQSKTASYYLTSMLILTVIILIIYAVIITKIKLSTITFILITGAVIFIIYSLWSVLRDILH